MSNMAPTYLNRGGSFSRQGDGGGSLTFNSTASMSSQGSRASQRSRGSQRIIRQDDDSLSLGSSNRRHRANSASSARSVGSARSTSSNRQQHAMNASSFRSVGSAHSPSILREPTVNRAVAHLEDDVRSVHSMPYSEARTTVLQPNYNSWAPPPPPSRGHPIRIQYCDDASSVASSYIDVASVPRYKASSIGHLSVVEEPRRNRNCCLIVVLLIAVVACGGAFALGMYFSDWFDFSTWFNNSPPKNDNNTSPSIADKGVQSLNLANVQMDLGRIDTNAEFAGDAISTWQHVTGEAIEREALQNVLDGIHYFEVLLTLSSQAPQEGGEEEDIQILRLFFDVEVSLTISDTITQNDNVDNEILFDSVRDAFDSFANVQNYLLDLRQTREPAFQQTVTVDVIMPVTSTPTPVPTPYYRPPTGVSLPPESSGPRQSFFDIIFESFLQISANDEFYLVELLKYRSQAEYSDPNAGFAATTGRNADQIYKDWIIQEVLPSISGAALIFEATVMDPSYDEILIIKYPSGNAFSRFILQSEEFADKIRHRQAGLASDKSIILATTLIDDNTLPGLLRQPPLDTPPYPPTSSDPSFIFLHLLHFRDSTGEQAMNDFDLSSTPLKNKYGVRAAGWLRIETVAFGSSQLDQVRLEYVPSLGTWGALLGEEDYNEIWKKREAGIMQETSISAITKSTTQSLPNLYNDN